MPESKLRMINMWIGGEAVCQGSAMRATRLFRRGPPRMPTQCRPGE